MSILYIRLPSRAAADSATDQLELPCPYALVVQGKAIAQQGISPLSGLAGQIAKAQRVVALLAASDVTLLRVKVPPLSPAKLKLVLPNLVEDMILGDPAECVIVAGKLSDGMRSIAVVQRGWINHLGKLLHGYGARQITALPAQLCLPDQPDAVHAAVCEHAAGIDLTLRLAEHEGIGLACGIGENSSAAQETIRALTAITPAAQITLYAPQTSLAAYQNEIQNSGNTRITVSADNWTHWIAGAAVASLDLMAEQRGSSGPKVDWRAWRWPLVLSAMVLLVNIAALNFDWLHLKRETDALRAAMFQTYRAAFPNESVIIDPLAQMQQKIAAARHSAGQASPDDFTAMIASFGEAWSTTTASAAGAPEIAAFEYRDRRLLVRMKPGAAAPTQQMKAALAMRSLSLELSAGQSTPVVWEIRSVR